MAYTIADIATHKMVNGESTVLSDNERSTLLTERNINKNNKDSAIAARTAKVDSTKTKLETLGFTADEIKDVFGI
jgi:hypothetical protein